MKTCLKTVLASRQIESGLTLIEVVVVMIMIGILSAIALPYVFNQTNKAKQTEAKLWLGTLNRAQQAHMLEHSRFTDKTGELGVGIKPNPNYLYRITLGDDGTLYAIHHADSLNKTLRPYVGMSAVLQDGSGVSATQTIICESTQPKQGEASTPTYVGSSVECGEGTRTSQ